MQDFRKLEIYKRAIEYSVSTYKFSTKLSASEKYGLVSQIRRAVSSIPLNISEGSGCNSNKEFALFINYGYRSCNEVLTCLELIDRLSLYKERKELELLEKEGVELNCMIYTFFKKIGGKTYNL